MLKNKHLGMALRTLLACSVLVGITALVASRVVSDDTKGQPEMTKEQMEAQKKMEEAGRPGPHHKHLDAIVGEWNCDSKFWMGPGEPMTAKATASYKWILDGRFVQEEYNSEFEGKPFKGIGTFGYDNTTKKYSSTWIDNMSTTLYVSSGTCDDSGKSFTFNGESPCCMTGKILKDRSEWKIISKDKHVFEMFKEGEDGKMMKVMEITYNRKA